MNIICSWRGCASATPLNDPMPDGWTWLITYRSPEPIVPLNLGDPNCPKIDRDGVLCPYHTMMFEGYLKRI